MLRAGLRMHGKLVGDRRKALFILHNIIHRDPASILPHEADAFWMTYFRDYYNYMTENDYTEEMAAYFRKKSTCKCRISGVSPRFVNKNLQNSFRVRLLNLIFPDAKFIHIIRDGRAVAFSLLNKKDGATSPILLVGFKDILRDKYQLNRSELYNYGLAWKEYVTKAREATAIAKSRYYEVRYENLVREPYNELRNIVDFCELDWYSKFKEKIPATQNMNEKWKQKASEEQRIDLEESTFDLRRTLGVAE